MDTKQIDQVVQSPPGQLLLRKMGSLVLFELQAGVGQDELARTDLGGKPLTGRYLMRAAPNREVLLRNEDIFNSEYLQRLRDHDPTIEAHFYSYFRLRLKVKLGGRRLQDSDVRDIIQDTFMRTLKAVRDNTIKSPNAFGGYVSSVCDFVLYEKYRERGRWHLDVDAIDIPDKAENLEKRLYEKERRQQAEKALDDLRPKDRNVLRAKIFDELSTDEICTLLGISPENLRVTLHRAATRFKKACRKRGLDFDPS